MKLVDRLVIRELLGPWIFGVCLFSTLLVAATYLMRVTNLFVEGIDIRTVMTLTSYYMPSLIVKSFPMAMLLASLLAFAKLSNDSEIVAAMAGGASLVQLMRPVFLFGLFVSVVTFVFGETIVPEASNRANVLQGEISKQLKGIGGTPFYQPLFIDGKLRGGLFASDVDPANDAMYNVSGVWYNQDYSPAWMMFARRVYYTPLKDWRIEGAEIYYVRNETVSVVRSEEMGPPEGSTFDFTPTDILSRRKLDFDTMSMKELSHQIEKKRKELAAVDGKDRQLFVKLRELETAYWNKPSLALTALVFALVGAPAAIRRTRQSFGVGLALSIAIIFAFYVAQTYLMILAKGGVVEPFVAAFLPVLIGLGLAVGLLWSKGR
jgi:lipopolysaccharide export system permease protein